LKFFDICLRLDVKRGYIRSDNGPEFASKAVKRWLKHCGVQTLFIEPGSPRENGYVESFIEKLRDELLFLHVEELRYDVDRWRMDYNHYQPHSSLEYMRPSAFATCNLRSDPVTLHMSQDMGNECNTLIETHT